MGAYANREEPVKTPQNVASDQGLHCLRTEISMQDTVQVKILTENLKSTMNS